MCLILIALFYAQSGYAQTRPFDNARTFPSQSNPIESRLFADNGGSIGYYAASPYSIGIDDEVPLEDQKRSGDPVERLIDLGLGFGFSQANSGAEKLFEGFFDQGQARLNFRFDRDGKFNGEGDLLVPFYDGSYTTVFTQLGLRSMDSEDKTRWIGNIGIGQRWFPFASALPPQAEGYDAGPLMLGYNLFYDHDFTRSHQRAGVGFEAQYDWLRLSTNFYTPLSSWKDSPDFDNAMVEERPAKGWDIRIKGYFPSYRQVAFTGSYTQWSGDQVGVFSSNTLEKDPKVWSYGMEYTPVPAITSSISQQRTERGQNETRIKLGMTYRFGIPWKEQFSADNVNKLRTVHGSRHEFVDRENKIILEYRDKPLLVQLGGSQFEGVAGSEVVVPFTTRSASAITAVAWEGSGAPFLRAGTQTEGRFLLPAYQQAGNNSYAVAVNIENERGQHARSDFAQLVVKPDTSTYRFTLSASNMSPVVGDKIGIEAVLNDGTSAVAGEALSWSMTPEAKNAISGDEITTAEGKARVTIDTTAMAIGEYTLTIGLASNPAISATIKISLKEPPTAYQFNMRMSPEKPNAGDLVEIQIQLKNFDASVAGATLRYEITSGDGTIEVHTVRTDAQGFATFTWRAGATDAQMQISAELDGVTLLSQKFTLTLQHDYLLTYSYTPAIAKPGDSLTFNVTMQNGSVGMSGLDLVLSLSNGDGELSATQLKTNTAGKASFTYIVGQKDTQLKIEAPTLSFVKEISIPVQSAYDLRVDIDNTNPDPDETVTFNATLMNGPLPVEGTLLTLALASGNGVVEKASATTDADGKAILSYHTAMSDSAVSLLVSAASPVSLNQEIHFNVVSAFELNHRLMTKVSPGQEAKMMAKLTNKTRPVSNQPLVLELMSGGGSTMTNTGYTDSDGETMLSWQAGTDKQAVLKVHAGSPEFFSKIITTDVVMDYQLVLTADAGSIKAGTLTGLTATLTNGGMEMAATDLVWSVTPLKGVLTADVVTDTKGQSRAHYQAAASGSVIIRVSLAEDPTIFAETTITILPAFRLELATSHDIINNGGDVTLSANLHDGPEPVANAAIIWQIISGSTGQAILQADRTNTNESGHTDVILTAQKGGTLTIRATLDAHPDIYRDVDVTIAPDYRLKLRPSTNVINNKGIVTLEVEVNDGDVKVPDAIINWSIVSDNDTSGRAILAAPVSTSQSNGIATNQLTATRGGKVTLQAAMGAFPAIKTQASIDITPVYLLTASPAASTIAPDSETSVTATLRDGDSYIEGETINWTIFDGHGSVSPQSSATSMNGRAVTTYTPEGGGITVIQATMESQPSIVAQVSITATDAFTLTFSDLTQTVKTGDTVALTAKLKNGSLPGGAKKLNWSILSGGEGLASLDISSQTTGDTGLSQAMLTANKAGDVTVHVAMADHPDVYADYIITIHPDYSLSIKTMPETVANGVAADMAVSLFDGNNAVVGKSIKFGVIAGTGDGNFFPATSQTATDGSARTVFTPTRSGSLTFEAQMGDDEAIKITRSITATPSFSLSLEASTATIKTGDSLSITAALIDGQNDFDGATIHWEIVGDTQAARLSKTSSVTAQGGTAQTTLIALKAGHVKLRAYVGDDLSTAQDLEFDILPHYLLTFESGSSAIMDNMQALPIRILLKDGDNLVANKDIRWSIAASGKASGTLNLSTSQTDTNGNAEAIFTATTGGTVLLRATLADMTSVTATQIITIKPRYSLDFTVASSTLNNDATTLLTAIVKDGQTPVENKLIDWDINTTGDNAGYGFISQDSTATNVTGTATAIFTATKGGTVTLKASLDEDSTLTRSLEITINPSFSITLKPNPANLGNGETSSITAHVKDGNTSLQGLTLQWQVLSGSGNFSQEQTITAADGRVINTFTPTTSGDVIIRVSFMDDPSVYKDLVFAVGSEFRIMLDGEQRTTKTGQSVNLSALLRDGAGVGMGEDIVWSIMSASTGKAQLTTLRGTTDNDGKTATTLNALGAGDVIVRAEMASQPSIYATFGIIIEPAYSLIYSAATTELKTGDVTPQSVTLYDGSNRVSGKDIAWSVLEGGLNSDLNRTQTQTGATGTASVNYSPSAASARVVIRAQLASDPTVYINSPALKVAPNYQLSTMADVTSVNTGATINLKAKLLDGAMAAVGQVVQWSVVGGNGEGDLSSYADVTDINGQVTTVLTTQKAGSLTLRASLPSNSSIYQDITVSIVPSYRIAIDPPPFLDIGLLSAVEISATVYDGNKRVEGITVDWKVTGIGLGIGIFSPKSSDSDEFGRVTSYLRGTGLGFIWATATVRGYPEISDKIKMRIINIL
ncbi:inverse autotransporter beta domain-containing protein [Bartonella sp. LJL80]